MTDWRQDRIGSAHRGENPTVLAWLPGAFAVMGDAQWLPGYCVLVTDDPAIDRLTDLPRPARLEFLASMERLGEAVQMACAEADPAFRRINLEIQGNTDAILHAHIWPRYDWEPPEILLRPVAVYPVSHWHDPAHALGPQHDALRAAITRRLVAGGDVGAGG